MTHNEQEEHRKELTLDDLARMVQEGFAQTASKEELHALRKVRFVVHSRELKASNLDRPQPSRRDLLVAAQGGPPQSEAGDPMRTC